MTQNINIKHQNKYKQPVIDFLEQHRHDNDSEVKHTHLSYGLFQGKFTLKKDDYKEFMKRYCKAINKGVTDLSILETQKEYAPIIVDIDLEIPSDDYNGERLYSDEMVTNIIKKYIEAIDTYLNVSEESYQIYLLEKNTVQQKECVYRDGFHLMFPGICTNSKIRHLIRYKVVELCKQEGTFDEFINGPEKIIDKAVVSSNAWFLYGSKKPGGQLYVLNKIYNNNLEIIHDHSGHSNIIITTEDIIKYLSLQSANYTKKNLTSQNIDYTTSDIDAECERLGVSNTLRNEQTNNIIPCNEDEIIKAVKFTSMLSEDRSVDYLDWLRVGLALHNVSDTLIDTWVEFSKKCSQKYKDGECEKIWRTMRKPGNTNVLTIRSLEYWARHDSPKQYEIFKKEEFKNVMKKSLDGSTYYLAKSVYTKYGDRFVCSSIDNNLWWEFKNHRWVRIESGYTLKMLFSDDFANEYDEETADISIRITKSKNFEKEELMERRNRIIKIINKLRDNPFKKQLIDECKPLFYDSKFEEKLDCNINLIGFENGIYDLEQGQFREGRPDDYITLSTGNDYHKWSEKNPYHKSIIKFFEQVLPNKNIREYFINVLASCLTGSTKDEKLYILNGSGSNGKSLTTDLMYMALGDYYMSCPISMISRKRGQSNETSPEKIRMKGRRCGIFQETDDGDKLNVGVMKEFTGGDKVLVRDLFKGSKDMIEFKPQMKYFLTCNQLPDVPSTDDGTWRRLRVIEFSSKFTDKPTKSNEYMIDNTLKQKIEMWAPAFVSYLIHVYNTSYKNMAYLKEPVEVMASTDQYKMENDYYTEYIHEHITITGNNSDTVKCDKLWDDFRVWYKSEYQNKPLPKKTEFTKFMNKLLNEPLGKSYKCIKLNNDNYDDNDDLAVPNQILLST